MDEKQNELEQKRKYKKIQESFLHYDIQKIDKKIRKIRKELAKRIEQKQILQNQIEKIKLESV